MKTKCPNCGAIHSLDSLLAVEDAADLMAVLAGLDAAIGKAALRYLGLFRPARSQLSFGRAAKLLAELMPDIRRGAISRNGTEYPAPPAAWLYGFQTALDARDAGRLKLPLKSHGWLYEVVGGWQGGPHPGPPPRAEEGMNVRQPVRTPATADSKLRQGVADLADWAGDDWLRQELAAGLAKLSAMNLQGRPAAQDLAVVANLWLERLEKREKWVAEFDRSRLQTAFRALQDTDKWPNAGDLIRNLPPRMIPRSMLEKPKPDRAKGREEMRKVRQSLNGKKGNEDGSNE